jgi:hypothetical protein
MSDRMQLAVATARFGGEASTMSASSIFARRRAMHGGSDRAAPLAAADAA